MRHEGRPMLEVEGWRQIITPEAAPRILRFLSFGETHSKHRKL